MQINVGLLLRFPPFVGRLAAASSAILFAVITHSNAASAQARESAYEAHSGARWVLPCGGPCTIVATIVRLDKFPSRNITRALVEFASPQGVRREWWFAYCSDERLGEWGFASDASDTTINEVYYYPYGEKEEWDGGAVANRFSRWKALCEL